MQKFVQVMNSTPLTVTDHIEPGLLLQPDGKNDHVVHDAIVFIHRHRISAIDEVTNELRSRKGSDDLSEEWRKGFGAIRSHITTPVEVGDASEA